MASRTHCQLGGPARVGRVKAHTKTTCAIAPCHGSNGEMRPGTMMHSQDAPYHPQPDSAQPLLHHSVWVHLPRHVVSCATCVPNLASLRHTVFFEAPITTRSESSREVTIIAWAMAEVSVHGFAARRACAAGIPGRYAVLYRPGS
jgi:hypothetical protein